MAKPTTRLFPILLVLAALGIGSSSLAAEARPIIIVIFCDDLGWADLGAQGIRASVDTALHDDNGGGVAGVE